MTEAAPSARTTLVRRQAPDGAGSGFRTPDIVVAQDLMRRVARDPGSGAVVHVYRPHPTVAFSRRESLLPGFQDAVSLARSLGFDAVIRPAGGRAVALDEGWLVIDIVTPEIGRRENSAVFLAYGSRFVGQFARWGIDARIGEIAGEYCPGRFSINARGKVKVAGTAQRVSRGARLFAAAVPFTVSDDVRKVLIAVNSVLGFDWDPATLGALAREAPGIEPALIERELAYEFAGTDAVERDLSDVLDEPGACPTH